MKQSVRFSWNSADTRAWLDKAIKVLVPYLVVIIPVLISQLPKDWAYSAIVVYVLQRVWDALRRFYDGPVK